MKESLRSIVRSQSWEALCLIRKSPPITTRFADGVKSAAVIPRELRELGARVRAAVDCCASIIRDLVVKTLLKTSPRNSSSRFEKSGFALIYQDKLETGDTSRFSKLIDRNSTEAKAA